MSQEHEEDVTDALLKDLESRSSAPTSSTEDDDEDLEAFLASLEDDSPPSRPVASKPASPAPAIKEAPKAELQVSEKKAAKKETAEKKSSEKEKAQPESSSSAKEKFRTLGTFLKVLLVSFSTLGLWWFLGAYLSQWISAWWLTLGLATILVGALPPALRLAARQRGTVSWWFAGISTSLLILLIAPIPNQAASAIGSYGHWPATSLAQGASLAPDWVGVRIFSWGSAKLASSLSAEATAPLVLGGNTPLTQAPQPLPVDTKPEPSVEAIEALETEIPASPVE